METTKSDSTYQVGNINSFHSPDSMAIGGEECIKYVGGPLRSYMGKSQRNILLELTVRPPGNEISIDTTSKVNKMHGISTL
jgi:hypothetical protein